MEKELRENFDKSLKELNLASAQKSRSRKHEELMGIAYNKLVLAGLEPKLRGKYRRGI